jgi:hypothetical protein
MAADILVSTLSEHLSQYFQYVKSRPQKGAGFYMSEF